MANRNDASNSRVWSDGDRIFLSERGEEAQEVRLGDSTHARRLRELLQQHGATTPGASLRIEGMILAGGGGCGFDWAPQDPAPAPRQSQSAPRSLPVSPDRSRAANSVAPATAAAPRTTANPRNSDRD